MSLDWQGLQDQSVIDLRRQRDIAEKWRIRECAVPSVDMRFFDFDGYGKSFTQVAIVVTPSDPLLVDGRPVVVVASEGGNDNGSDFISDLRGREGIGPWLARRGVTFIALCRVGRWNFLSQDSMGSWTDVPLERRMPVFHRRQDRHRTEEDYVTIGAKGVSSPTGSLACRVPRPGSSLEEHMMALTPLTTLTGFSLGCDACLPSGNLLTVYWGFSTGGSYMWAFAKLRPPTGVLGYGMTGFPFTRYSIAAAGGVFAWTYDRSTFRVRERGLPDFDFYNRHLPPDEREAQYAVSLRSPRFKSNEDHLYGFQRCRFD